MVETTILVRQNVLSGIASASVITGKPRSTIVVMLIKRIMDDNRPLLREDRCVEYQERQPGKEWHRLHVYLHMKEYECFLDLRKFCKKSVSFLVAFGVYKYLDEIIKELEIIRIIPDNYLINHYSQKTSFYKGVYYWRIIWGKPQKHSKHHEL